MCDARSGEAIAKIKCDPNLKELAWLKTNSFAYSTSYDNNVMLVIQKPDGQWVAREIVPHVADSALENFTAISDDAVAWRAGESVWMMDFQTSAPRKIWESNTNRLLEFTFSKTTGEFLLNCKNAKGQFLLGIDLNLKPTSSVELDGPRNSSKNEDWVDHGSGYGYLKYGWERKGTWLKLKPDLAPIRVTWPGWIHNYTVVNHRIFFTGDEDFKLPGIWEYDIDSETYHCIVSSFKSGFDYANGFRQPSVGSVTNSSLAEGAFWLWEPAHFSKTRKYPVIISNRFWNLFPYAQIASNEGYYVAVVDDDSLFSELYENVIAACPNIDTNRVFFYAGSAASELPSELLVQKPDLLIGVILFSPTALPNVSDLSNKRALLVDGSDDDKNLVGRLPAYQDQAAALGITLELYIQKGSSHIPDSIGTERCRVRQFAKFLSREH